ncbi:MAG: PQQ-binding-like beta-propeller repeat protein, partial [Aquificales bacterium]|nr:PQQ-binding-like beta-propeller repeat protein [Aquificales bacterium]
AETGQKIWHQRVDARNITRVVAYDGFVSVEASPDSFSIFDASNGSFQSRNSVPIMGYSSFANDGNVRFDYDRSYIRAYDIQDNSLIWDVSFEDAIVYRPVFSNGLIIVHSGRYSGTLHVLDSETGRQLWEKEGVVSDFGVNDKTLFFVTTQGEILAVDVETGETQGRLILNDAELNTQNGAFASYSSYFVRVVDDIILVYLGDTGQLFSFQYSNE